MLTSVPDPRQFGVAELDAVGEVIGLEEKPSQPKGDLALVGVYIFTPAVHEAAARLSPSWRGGLGITQGIHWVIDKRRQGRATTSTGDWEDTRHTAHMLESRTRVRWS